MVEILPHLHQYVTRCPNKDKVNLLLEKYSQRRGLVCTEFMLVVTS